MYKIVKQKRAMLREIRIRVKELSADIKNKRSLRKELREEMAKLRKEIRAMKGIDLSY